MKNKSFLSYAHKAILILQITLFTLSIPACAEPGRWERDISLNVWKLWLDREAEWIEDDICMPQVDISHLPVNPPTCGWDELEKHTEKTVRLPATIEEHFWADNDNPNGVAGDYRGVSWWVTSVTPDTDISGKRIFLDFESVHLRAEVFVNRRLAGYDVIGHTPFSVDITGAVKPGEKNEIAVRITDPAGNFSWNDRAVLKWGSHDIPPCHGFGGITGRVFFRAVDPVYIEDIFVKNKSAFKEVDVIVTIKNTTGKAASGTFSVKVYPWENPDTVIWKKTFKRRISPAGNEFIFTVKAARAKLWDPENPNLYTAEVIIESPEKETLDSMARRFGFRWFDIGDKNGDKRFYLNGKRIVLRSGMSWGFWPVNGVFPTREMAERDVITAKEFGLNMMNFHRAIGQPPVMEAADEMGLLCYEESGGYSCEGADINSGLWRQWRREKLLRMVKRDRSHPSLIIYNLQNRTPNELADEDVVNMKTVHEMDPSRIITFISGFWKPLPKEHPAKLFLKPNDFTENYTGWFDMHMFSPAQSYADGFYNNPGDFTRYSGDKDEIVFWGEDGALNNPPRLQLIREYHEKRGTPPGWMGRYFIDWHDAYDDFLDRSGFRKFFPDVDALTTSIGNVSLYYHGRIMENIRMGNVTDCYTINGWAANHLTNHCDIADLYRNPVGDPEILAKYCRPLYVAVKLRDKVVPAGTAVTADFYLVNETGLSGRHSLTVTLKDANGKSGFEKTYKVNIPGGEEYGSLLAEGVEIPLDNIHGYFTVRAKLTGRKEKLIAEGDDRVFSVSMPNLNISKNRAVIDTSGIINRMLIKTLGIKLPIYESNTLDYDCIIIGANSIRRRQDIVPIMECVKNGATAIVLDSADRFADLISSSSPDYYAVDYRGRYPMLRGNFIAGRHELLEGLPQAQAFNWEYQVFNFHRGHDIFALRLYNADTVVAAVSDNKKEVGTALAVVPFGRGRIVLSTLNIMPWLDSDTPQSVVARRLLMNCLEYAGAAVKK